MRVTKRNVEQFQVGVEWLDREQASDLYRALAMALGLPVVENKGCGDRMSHGAHWHGGNKQHFYCSGRSFDAT